MKTIHRSLKYILILCFIIVIVACETENDYKPVISEDPKLLTELLNSSLDTIKIGVNKLILRTYLQRDFMPGIPSRNKHPLTASVLMTDIDSVQISNDLDISKVYVIKGNLIWISTPKNLTQSDTSDFILKRVSANGPEWETNYVDVIIEIISISSNNKYLLIAKHQYINKTY
jgi:hypothetical protein